MYRDGDRSQETHLCIIILEFTASFMIIDAASLLLWKHGRQNSKCVASKYVAVRDTQNLYSRTYKRSKNYEKCSALDGHVVFTPELLVRTNLPKCE